MVTQIDAPDPVAVGGHLVYTVTLRNAGGTTATSVTLFDFLPSAVTLQSAPGCSASGRSLTCAVGTLAPGANRVFTIDVIATFGPASLADAGG